MIPRFAADQPDPAQMLVQAAVQRAGQEGFSLDPEALLELTSLLSDATDRAADATGVAGIDDLLKMVTDLQPKVFHLVQLMIESPPELQLQPNTLGHASLQSAWHRFCPIFPFC